MNATRKMTPEELRLVLEPHVHREKSMVILWAASGPRQAANSANSALSEPGTSSSPSYQSTVRYCQSQEAFFSESCCLTQMTYIGFTCPSPAKVYRDVIQVNVHHDLGLGQYAWHTYV